jgi:hypothetical protein
LTHTQDKKEKERKGKNTSSFIVDEAKKRSRSNNTTQHNQSWVQNQQQKNIQK